MSDIPRGPYTVWQNYGTDGWHFTDYPTLEEALLANRHGYDWCITKMVQFKLVDMTPEEIHQVDGGNECA